MKFKYYRAVHACSGGSIGYMLAGELVAECLAEAEKLVKILLKNSYGKVVQVD